MLRGAEASNRGIGAYWMKERSDAVTVCNSVKTILVALHRESAPAGVFAVITKDCKTVST
jgi:hypothetical protein